MPAHFGPCSPLQDGDRGGDGDRDPRKEGSSAAFARRALGVMMMTVTVMMVGAGEALSWLRWLLRAVEGWGR